MRGKHRSKGSKFLDVDKARSQDFRWFLQSELSRRVRENPEYSLRSFAKALQIDPSALAKLLKGSRSLGSRVIAKLGKKLGLKDFEIQEFVRAQEDIKSRPTGSSVHPLPYQPLIPDTFRLISDWHHYAILELIRVSEFCPDPVWISKTIDVPVTEVGLAIERMLRLKLLVIDESGKWMDQSERATNIVDHHFGAAQRRLQK